MSNLDIPCYAFNARHASRHLSQFYEHRIVGTGVHAQQFTTLAIVESTGPLSVIELAHELAQDRTTLARNLKPLEREALIAITPSKEDRRIRMISITAIGRKKLAAAKIKWREAQAEFEQKFGADRAERLRIELRAAAAAAAAAVAT